MRRRLIAGLAGLTLIALATGAWRVWSDYSHRDYRSRWQVELRAASEGRGAQSWRLEGRLLVGIGGTQPQLRAADSGLDLLASPSPPSLAGGWGGADAQVGAAIIDERGALLSSVELEARGERRRQLWRRELGAELPILVGEEAAVAGTRTWIVAGEPTSVWLGSCPAEEPTGEGKGPRACLSRLDRDARPQGAPLTLWEGGLWAAQPAAGDLLLAGWQRRHGASAPSAVLARVGLDGVTRWRQEWAGEWIEGAPGGGLVQLGEQVCVSFGARQALRCLAFSDGSARWELAEGGLALGVAGDQLLVARQGGRAALEVHRYSAQGELLARALVSSRREGDRYADWEIVGFGMGGSLLLFRVAQPQALLSLAPRPG